MISGKIKSIIISCISTKYIGLFFAMFSLAMASSSSAVTPSPFAITSVIGAEAIPEASLDTMIWYVMDKSSNSVCGRFSSNCLLFLVFTIFANILSLAVSILFISFTMSEEIPLCSTFSLYCSEMSLITLSKEVPSLYCS